MLIVAGWLRVDPKDRDAYVADCRDVVRAARRSPGCLDFALSADPVERDLVLVHERWEDEASLLAFRSSGPDGGQARRILGAHVRRYEIGGEGPA